jgi:hypothetical protein
MVEGEIKKRLNIAAITGRPEFKDDDPKHPVMVNRKYVLDVLDEARKDFYGLLKGDPLDWLYHTGEKKQTYEQLLLKWFGSAENTVK